MGVRKNQSTLTVTEKQKFVAAVLALKQNGKWDQYVQQHAGAHMPAHRGPAFLPWHREYLRRLELDLQAIDPTVSLPYWDWTVDNQPTSSIWGNDFMGPDGRPSDGRAMSGPFAFSGGAWTLAPGSSTQFLARRMGTQVPTLPTPAEVAACLMVTPYDSAPWGMSSSPSFRNQLEGWISSRAEPEIHNRVHVWVGGSMLPMTSPNDPVFFLHHCNIDRLWAQWQASHPGLPYLPASGGPTGHNLNDSMLPWGGTTTVAGVLDHRALGYCYDTEPGCVGKPKEKDKEKELKREKLEFKETIKAEKPERKELKREKVEFKETIKAEKRESKELKREKLEFEKGVRQEKIRPEKLQFEKFREGGVEKFREGGGGFGGGPVGGLPEEVVGERIERLEGMVDELVHFIGGELRPDLGEGALTREPDLAALSDELASQAKEAKDAKDAKDVEKLREL